MSITGQFITRSAEETFELGKKIGEQLNSRAVFLLSGDLGSGKTVFAKGVAEGLDIDSTDVTSPTFTLVNIYDGRLRLYHIDLYRLDEGASPELGLEEILDEERAVVIIEWAERLNFAPDGAIKIEINYLSDSERKIDIRHLAQ
jgi:tRNA threonylcarbamoyladenosine biosynthesis protein TsaE